MICLTCEELKHICPDCLNNLFRERDALLKENERLNSRLVAQRRITDFIAEDRDRWYATVKFLESSLAVAREALEYIRENNGPETVMKVREALRRIEAAGKPNGGKA